MVREAAAVDTPAILLEGSTAAELVRDGDNGFLTRRTPEAYAAAIRAIASDPIMKEKPDTEPRHSCTFMARCHG